MTTYVVVEMTVTDPVAIEEYRAACEIRDRAARTRMVAVEGMG